MTEEDIQDLVRALAGGASVREKAGIEAELESLGLGFVKESGSISLTTPLELLDANRIGAGISESTRAELSQLDALWSVDSTNTWLLERVANPAFHGSVCLAERQLAGKGRRGRHWVSPFGKNVYLSIGWSMSTKQVSIAGLSLVVGMQVVSVLRGLGVNDVGLKWPNDVLIGGGKLAGILVEMVVPNRGEARLVIGVGINLRLDQRDAEAIDQRFSTIGEQYGLSRNDLAANLINALVPALVEFQKTGFGPWAQIWCDYNVYGGQPVRVHRNDGDIEGIDRGVDEEGNLLLETSTGIEPFNAGEVSLRPIPQ